MSANSDNHEPRLDDQDPVWQLLARAPRPEPDGWFTARTLARCRQVERQVEKGWTPLWRVWRWAIGGGIGVCLAAFLVVTQVQPNPTATTDQKSVQEAFEIVATAGSDSDSSSTPSTWQDSSL